MITKVEGTTIFNSRPKNKQKADYEFGCYYIDQCVLNVLQSSITKRTKDDHLHLHHHLHLHLLLYTSKFLALLISESASSLRGGCTPKRLVHASAATGSPLQKTMIAMICYVLYTQHTHSTQLLFYALLHLPLTFCEMVIHMLSQSIISSRVKLIGFSPRRKQA